ncbi:MAG: hypothetical protein QGI09_12220, partial [Dehalococcoidia bacterium]|nr:hypothetical protein [Dehalococcoidia bacterium]
GWFYNGPGGGEGEPTTGAGSWKELKKTAKFSVQTDRMMGAGPGTIKLRQFALRGQRLLKQGEQITLVEFTTYSV